MCFKYTRVCLFTFSYKFVGSSSRNMITCDFTTNKGFDFDDLRENISNILYDRHASVWSVCVLYDMNDQKNDPIRNSIAANIHEIKENVTADVIKIGHHGSNTSSSIDFIKKVNAKYGIISVGLNNKYNLPKEETIANWENSGTKIYLTSTNGTIRASSDGTNIKIESEK